MNAGCESAVKVVRNTSGLDVKTYISTPMVELLDWSASYEELIKKLHPAGLRCSCGADNYTGHGKSRTGNPVYKCRECGATYNILSGTIFSGCTIDARGLVLFMRLMAEGMQSGAIGRAVGLHGKTVHKLMQKVKIYSRHMAN